MVSSVSCPSPSEVDLMGSGESRRAGQAGLRLWGGAIVVGETHAQ